MLPVIVIILSSLILMFSILRKRSVDDHKKADVNLNSYYALKENTSPALRMKVLLDAAIANTRQREECYSKRHIIQYMYNQRLFSPGIWNRLRATIKDLEYEQLVIEAEAELLKPGWSIFSDANKMLPQHKRKEERIDKESKFKENTFLVKKKETLENQLMARLMSNAQKYK